ncbi:MAG: DUF502 domain-containing protein [Candidatus Babeliales bacterium]|jgi:uncharacterized membrane protein
MPNKNKKSFFEQIIFYLRKFFLNGLIAVLPLTLTVALFNVSFRLIANWLTPLTAFTQDTLLRYVPYSEIILAIILVCFIGTLYNFFVLRSLINFIERLASQIPLVRTVYSGIRQLVRAFSLSEDEIAFKKVVLVEFPREGIYSLGFLTSELQPEIAPNPKKKFFNVFIPTAPNPTSGYFVIASEDDFIIVDLTRQEAMGMIISGGIIQPERFSKEK